MSGRERGLDPLCRDLGLPAIACRDLGLTAVVCRDLALTELVCRALYLVTNAFSLGLLTAERGSSRPLGTLTVLPPVRAVNFPGPKYCSGKSNVARVCVRRDTHKVRVISLLGFTFEMFLQRVLDGIVDDRQGGVRDACVARVGGAEAGVGGGAGGAGRAGRAGRARQVHQVSNKVTLNNMYNLHIQYREDYIECGGLIVNFHHSWMFERKSFN